MKAKVRISDFNGKVEVEGREAVISSKGRDSDFSVSMIELEQPGINEIMVFPRKLMFQIERKDDWVINIELNDLVDKQNLVIYRFKRPKVGGTITFEHLTEKGEWKPEPVSSSELMRIPVLFWEPSV